MEEKTVKEDKRKKSTPGSEFFFHVKKSSEENKFPRTTKEGFSLGPVNSELNSWLE